MNKNMRLKECRTECLNNCSCMAYSNSDIKEGGSGCAIWYGHLIDIRQFSAAGQDLYVRMPASEIGMGLILFVLFLVSLLSILLHKDSLICFG